MRRTLLPRPTIMPVVTQPVMSVAARAIRTRSQKSQYKKFDLRAHPFLYELNQILLNYANKHPYKSTILFYFVFWTCLTSLYFLPHNIGKSARNLAAINTGMRLRLMGIEEKLERIAKAAEKMNENAKVNKR